MFASTRATQHLHLRPAAARFFSSTLATPQSSGPKSSQQANPENAASMEFVPQGTPPVSRASRGSRGRGDGGGSVKLLRVYWNKHRSPDRIRSSQAAHGQFDDAPAQFKNKPSGNRANRPSESRRSDDSVTIQLDSPTRRRMEERTPQGQIIKHYQDKAQGKFARFGPGRGGAPNSSGERRPYVPRENGPSSRYGGAGGARDRKPSNKSAAPRKQQYTGDPYRTIRELPTMAPSTLPGLHLLYQSDNILAGEEDAPTTAPPKITKGPKANVFPPQTAFQQKIHNVVNDQAPYAGIKMLRKKNPLPFLPDTLSGNQPRLIKQRAKEYDMMVSPEFADVEGINEKIDNERVGGDYSRYYDRERLDQDVKTLNNGDKSAKENGKILAEYGVSWNGDLGMREREMIKSLVDEFMGMKLTKPKETAK
ncbi:hypothetical protein [Phaffia rhodozyma]|uniref:Uncharacterized protein n=1 Tax=Phaffia rhodozyma TaxID=264483 RepID=A0A0F7SE46_PHARH|nr:hypothetical protein [Phaffia rhodozyma]